VKARRSRRPVPSFEGRLCLLTGAASGIGRATAIAAASKGARLVLTDVNDTGLSGLVHELDGFVAAHRALDLTDVDAVRALADEVHSAYGPLDVVMNIAGIATWGTVDRLTHDQWRRTIDVNLMGPIHVIECFVPEMIRAGRGGQLVNVSSAAGLIALPWHAPYSASKFGLRGVSEVLRFDLRRHRIGVTLVCPGAVNTSLVDTLDVAGVPHAALEASGLSDRFRRRAASPERVAELILDAVTRNRYLVHTAADTRGLYLLERLAPPIYARAMQGANHVFHRVMTRVASRQELLLQQDDPRRQDERG
jgi:NAD(P)-dependent dehydrogenase (short-subunit alcohol dehydrogenase family)